MAAYKAERLAEVWKCTYLTYLYLSLNFVSYDQIVSEWTRSVAKRISGTRPIKRHQDYFISLLALTAEKVQQTPPLRLRLFSSPQSLGPNISTRWES